VTIQFVRSAADDLAGVYINGRLHYQGGRIPDSVWINLLKGTEEVVSEDAVNEMGGELPGNFRDIVWQPTPLGRVDVEAAKRT
jgi:hypothetical protein